MMDYSTDAANGAVANNNTNTSGNTSDNTNQGNTTMPGVESTEPAPLLPNDYIQIEWLDFGNEQELREHAIKHTKQVGDILVNAKSNDATFRNHAQTLLNMGRQLHNNEQNSLHFQAAQQEEVERLTTQNNVLQAQLANTQVAPHFPHAHTPRLSAKIADPDKFGGDQKYLRAFVHLIRNKLSFNADHFMGATPEATRLAQLNYVFSRTDGMVSTQILASLDKQLTTAEEIILFLLRSYDDPDRQASAQNEMRGLQQKNRPFIKYLTEFQACMADTGYDMPSLKTMFKHGLSVELKDKLITLPDMDFWGLVEKCQTMDNGIQQLKANPFYKKNSSIPGTPRAQSPFASPQSSPSSSPRLTPTSPATTTNGGDAMDLSAGTTRPVSAEQRKANNAYRRLNNLCLYCGSDKHFLGQCDQRPKRTVNSPLRTELRAADTAAGPADPKPENA